MGDNNVSAATLLDSIDLAWDDSQIARTILSMLKAPDYNQLLSTLKDTQPPPENAVKFVNALDKVCDPSLPYLSLTFHTNLTPYILLGTRI